MSLEIITADQRMADMTTKGVILGPAGVGKTTLLKTLPPATTLFVSLEEGEISLQREDEYGPAFMGDTIRPSNWVELVQLTEALYMNPRPPALAKYKLIFFDSITVASHWCFQWAQTQPRAFSEKTGKPDIRGAYGLTADTMIEWAWALKRLPGVSVWLIGGLEQTRLDPDNEYSPLVWRPLLVGKGTAKELPFIMDYCLVMNRFQHDGQPYTGLFTDPWGEYGSVPVKTRGGGFAAIEPPNLGAFINKALGRPASLIAPPPDAIAA